MVAKTEAGQKEEWHMEKKLIIGIISAVLINMSVSIWQGFFILKTLDTDPPIIERIIRLEYHMSEHGRVNLAILDELKEGRKERAVFRKEQSRRTPMINYIERKLGMK